MSLTTRRRASHLQDSPASQDPPPADSDSSPSLPLRLFQFSISTLLSTFHTVTTFSPSHVPGSPYSTILHSKPWVYYRGTHTYVPISILGAKELKQEERKIVLQKRGWRTGLFGWSVGAMMGGLGRGKETDVTPENVAEWKSYTSKGQENDTPALSRKGKAAYDAEIEEFLKEYHTAPKDHTALETALVRIPVAAGDGYFRLAVYAPKSSSALSLSRSTTPIAHTSTFRIGSLSLASAQPRGASPLTLVPELVLRSASLSVWGVFWAFFPVFKIAQMVPGPSSRLGQWAVDQAWGRMGGQAKVSDLKDKWKVEERSRMAGEQFFRTMPFGSAGIRTDFDMREDMRVGRGGVALSRK